MFGLSRPSVDSDRREERVWSLGVTMQSSPSTTGISTVIPSSPWTNQLRTWIAWLIIFAIALFVGFLVEAR